MLEHGARKKAFRIQYKGLTRILFGGGGQWYGEGRLLNFVMVEMRGDSNIPCLKGESSLCSCSDYYAAHSVFRYGDGGGRTDLLEFLILFHRPTFPDNFWSLLDQKVRSLDSYCQSYMSIRTCLSYLSSHIACVHLHALLIDIWWQNSWKYQKSPQA